MQKLYLQIGKPPRLGWRTIEIVNETGGDEALKEQQRCTPGLDCRLVDETQISNRVDASWSISLDAECPFCGEMIDVVAGEWPEGITPMEHDTDQTRGSRNSF